MKILGLISGTSHDGIDAAVIDVAEDGAGLSARVRYSDTLSYPDDLRADLVAALPPAETMIEDVARLDTRIGQAFAEAAAAAIAVAGAVDLIVSHGQTVYHWVDDGAVRGTLQIGQPAWIAELTGAPVLSDVRIRDITAGGQGAPLASTLDALLLAGRSGSSAALNLGGISNVTVVDENRVSAWDIGPANALIDAVIVDGGLHPGGFDESGRIAESGRINEKLLIELLREPYYALASPKSTGKELFHLEYVRAALRRADVDLSQVDLVATLTELTIRTVADALRPYAVDELFVSGGGVHNDVIMAGLTQALSETIVATTDVLGVGADEKEAVLMAVIGWLSWHGTHGTVPEATGATAGRILGTITPGASPLRLPDPRPQPRFLQVANGATDPGASV